MRKTAKILAVLLTLCLLCGIMVSVVASAAEAETVTPHESLNVSNHTYNQTWTFSDAENNPALWNTSLTHPSMILGVGGTSDNYYLQSSSNGINLEDDKAAKNLYMSSTFRAKLSGVTYFTFDYDFGTDRYVYWDAQGVSHTYVDGEPITDLSEVPEGAIKVLPAYGTSNTNYNYMMFYYGSSLKRTHVNVLYDSEAGKYYLATDSGEGKIYLSNEVGVFDHITVVTKFSNSQKTLDEYIYVNGEYLGHQQTTVTTAPTQLHSLRPYYHSDDFFINNAIISKDSTGSALQVNGVTLKEGDSFSHMYDNFALNFYASETTYDFTQPIYNNPDVLYNEKYNFSPNGSATLNNAVVNVTTGAPNSLAKYLQTGDTITTTMSIHNFKPNDNVESFSVICNNGATFSLAAGAGFEEPVVDGNKYTYSKSAPAYIIVDGGEPQYDLVEGAKLIKDGSEVVVSGDFTGVSVPAGVKIFTVICENDAIFSLAEGSPYQAIVNEEADKTVYTVSYRKLNVSENSSNIYWNFEDGVNPWGTFATGSETTIKTLNGNKYATYGIIEGDAGAGSRTNTRLTINKTLASDVQYVTFDYDFGTDKYLVDTDGDGKFDTYSDTPVEGCIPAYGYSPNETGMCDDYFFFMQFCDASSTANTYNFKKMYIGFEEETKQYFLHFEGSDVKAYLSNEVGVFDHITNVYQFVSNPAGGYTISEYVYVNGVHCFTNDLSVTGEVRVYRIMASSFGAAVANRYYAYAFDNIALNCYTDDIFGAEYDFTAPIYNNSNVLYNKDTYVTPNYDRYMTVDEDMTWIINAGLDAIEENSNVTVSEAKVNTNLSVNSINLSLINGAKFNVQNVAYSFVPAGENSFTVTKGDLAQAYMDLAGDMTFNLIVNAGGTIASVDGEYIAYFDGNKIFWTPAIENYDSNRITIYYDANKTVSTTITLDVVKYAENVSEYYGCGSEEAKLVYEIMAYKEAVVEYVINGNLHSTTLNDYMTAHKECGCNVTNSLSSDDAGYVIPEELSGIGISYAPSLGKIGIIIEGVAEGTDITVSYSYIYEGDTVTEPFSVEYVTEGEGYYIVEGSAAYLSQTLDFNIGGTEFKYSIQQYFHNITEASGEEGLPYYTEELVLKMYEYSVAAFNYKFDFEGEDAVPAE